MYDWEGQTVLDRDGDKIGTIEEIFLVEETGRPEWALVKVGKLKGHTTLVPLRSARQIGDGVRVSVDKDEVSDAPAVKSESELGEQQVMALYRHYGLDPGTGSTAPNGNGNANANAYAAGNGTGEGKFRAPQPAPSAAAPPPAAPQTLHGTPDPRDRPVGDLLNTVKQEGANLAKQEVRLAKAEMTEKAKDVGIGAGMFGGAGYVAHLASLALMATIIFALAEVMAAWLAALIVTVVYAAIAGVLAMKAKKKIKQAGPPIPEQTVESVKQTIQTVKEEAAWGMGQTR